MSKRLIPYMLCGLLLVSIPFYLSLLLDFNFLGLAVVFVVPVGGLLIASALGSAARLALLRDNCDFTKGTALVIGLFALLTVLGLTYLDYATCFVDAGKNVNHLFRGTHISMYETSDGIWLNFPGYVKVTYLQATFSIIVRHMATHPIDTGVTGFGVIIYALQYIVAALGSILFASTISEEPKCPRCNKYYLSKEVGVFSDEEKALPFLRDLMEENFGDSVYKPVIIAKTDGAIITRAMYCPDCRIGMLGVYRYKVTGQDAEEEKIMSMELNSNQLSYLGVI